MPRSVSCPVSHLTKHSYFRPGGLTLFAGTGGQHRPMGPPQDSPQASPRMGWGAAKQGVHFWRGETGAGCAGSEAFGCSSAQASGACILNQGVLRGY